MIMIYVVMCGEEVLDFSIATPAVLVSIMLRRTGKRRALSVLEKREICQRRNMQREA